MPQEVTPNHFAARDDESGSIGIGAMIVFIALILVAAVASTIIIKTAEELQQNAESTSDDTRKQISGKISILDVFVKTAADPLTTTANTDVATMDVIARVASGSIGVAQGDITYYISCKVTYTDLSATFAVIDSGDATAVELDGTAIGSGVEIGAGSTFKFEIDLTPTDASADGTTVSVLDFALGLEPGCDAEAGVGATLDMRIVVDGGGETLSTLEIDSLTYGTSLM
jgi:flagellin FlaB